MGVSDNKYIRKARRKRTIKRIIFFFILVAIGLGIFITKTNFFLIKDFKIKGDNLITTNSVSEKLQSIKGENIFFVKSDEIERLLKSDPYINGVTIKRKFPATLEVNVTEKNVCYYIKCKDGKYDIISSDLVLLEKVNKLKTNDLIELTGLKDSNVNLGEKYINLEDDTRLENFLNKIYEIKKVNKSNKKITKINLSNLNDILVYFKDVEVKVGNGSKIVTKINNAISILENKKINMKKGYIDVSFEGTLVIKVEK